LAGRFGVLVSVRLSNFPSCPGHLTEPLQPLSAQIPFAHRRRQLGRHSCSPESRTLSSRGTVEGRWIKIAEGDSRRTLTCALGQGGTIDILYLLIPLSVVLVFLIGAVFWWSLRSGQFDDLEGPAHRILQDDDDPKGQ